MLGVSINYSMRTRVARHFINRSAKMSTMNAETAVGESSYTIPVKAMHWASGVSVLGTFAFVQLAQNTKDKKAKMSYMFTHKSFGTLAAFLIVPRLATRLMSKSAGHLTTVRWEQILSQISHTVMYGFLIAMPTTGVAMGYYGGKGLPFFWTTLPGASKENKNGKLAGRAFKLHKQMGWYMEVLFLGHMAGVGYHVAKGEKILARILPLAK